MKLSYRPEIDGLRSIAVLAVVIYHAKFGPLASPYLSGGYLGVDIFFVISGYLIGSIILGDMRSGHFSYARFYERRIRRILPALFLVLFASTFLAWKFMLPASLMDFSKSLLSSLGFGSNIWFWLEDSYTAEASLTKPLLHTWSLAVEEQFYIVFPVLLVLLWRFFHKHVSLLLLIIALASLCAAQYASKAIPDAAFYLLPFRAWELLAGALLARLELNRERKASGLYSQVLPLVGLLAFAFSFLSYSDTTPHPSILTLVPVIGTMLIIWFSGPTSFVTQTLSSRPLVGIGLISYSLYLWHFPLFAITRRTKPEASDSDYLLLIALSFALAVLSYFLVEKPFRNHLQFGRKLLALSLFLSFTLLVVPNILFILNMGYPERLGAVVGMFDNLKPKRPADLLHCIDDQGRLTCGSFTEGRQRIVVIGDSHAQMLTDKDSGIPAIAKSKSLDYIGLYASGCTMVLNTHIWTGIHKKQKCADLALKVDTFLAQQPPLTIVYSTRLPIYLEGSRFNNGEGGIEQTLVPYMTVSDNPRPEPEAVAKAITNTLSKWLSYGHKLAIVYPVPETGWHIPHRVKAHLDQFDANAKLEAYRSLDITTDYKVVKARRDRAYQALDRVGQHPRVYRIYPEKHLCSGKTMRCKTHDKHGLIYYDANHLSIYGASLVLSEDSLSDWLNQRGAFKQNYP